MNKSIVAMDIECYTNYFLVLFKSQSGKMFSITMLNDNIDNDINIIKTILKRHLIVTFNGNNYDLWILAAFLKGASNAELKALSDAIITENLFPWELSKRFPNVIKPQCDHIDLVGCTPLQASLKTYGCRIHSPKLQDLPIEPSAIITESDAASLYTYCINDVDVTLQIFETMIKDIQLRNQMGPNYNADFRSLSGPQIAERVLKSELNNAGVFPERRKGPVKPFKYNKPDYIRFTDTALNTALQATIDATFEVSPSGKVNLPDALKKVINFAGAKYKMGIGGLHSQEKKQAIVPKNDEILGEFDVASMYPSLISNLGMYPKHVGPEFLDVYRNMIDERLTAKRSGDKHTSNALKLVLNSSYGKFGSMYSWLYSPELLVQTTVTGQLCLLMLIEQMTTAGFTVVSANTDGVNVLLKKAEFDKAQAIADNFKMSTGLELEWTPYAAVYSESVNSYIAFKNDGDYKTKGTYDMGAINKGYANQICVEAVIAYLLNNIPIDKTIMAEIDVRKFLTMRGVKGGGVWRGQELGKVVRWYKATDGESILYKTNGNKVATSDCAHPMMDLTNELPGNLNKAWYIDEAQKMLNKLGIN